MRNLIDYRLFEALNELRALGMPYRIMSSHHGWEEIHRESITVNVKDEEREIGFISYGIANVPTHNRWFSIINIETEPISGWGSHQIMTVHQGDWLNREDALKDLESHWKTMKFKSINVKREEYPTIGFSDKR